MSCGFTSKKKKKKSPNLVYQSLSDFRCGFLQKWNCVRFLIVSTLERGLEAAAEPWSPDTKEHVSNPNAFEAKPQSEPLKREVRNGAASPRRRASSYSSSSCRPGKKEHS